MEEASAGEEEEEGEDRIETTKQNSKEQEECGGLKHEASIQQNKSAPNHTFQIWKVLISTAKQRKQSNKQEKKERQHRKMSVRKVFEDKAMLGRGLAAFVAAKSTESIADHGYFAVAFSGGSLPKLLASGIEELKTDTSKWKVFFADERCVAPDHDDSNFKAVFNDCLSKVNQIRAMSASRGGSCCS